MDTITLSDYIGKHPLLKKFEHKFRAYVCRCGKLGNMKRTRNSGQNAYYYNEKELDSIKNWYYLKEGCQSKDETQQEVTASSFVISRIQAPSAYYAYNKLVLFYYNVYKLQGMELHKVATFFTEEDAQDYCIKANRRGIDANV